MPRGVHIPGFKGDVPEGIREYWRLALPPGAFPAPSTVLRNVPDNVQAAYVDTLNRRARGDRESGDARRHYMTLLADAVMNENQIHKEKRGAQPERKGLR